MTINLADKGGQKVPTSIINYWSDGSTSQEYMLHLKELGKSIATGALTADTYPVTPQLSITGSGYVHFIAVYSSDSTSRQLGGQLVLDGTTVFDAYQNAYAGQSYGFVMVGGGKGGASQFPVYTLSLPFSASLSVSVKSSITETNKSKVVVAYTLT